MFYVYTLRFLIPLTSPYIFRSPAFGQFGQKEDSWFQYYYDATGSAHADDPKQKTRTLSKQYRWRYGVRSRAHISFKNNHMTVILLILSKIVIKHCYYVSV